MNQYSKASKTGDILRVVAPYDVSDGDGVLVGNIFGIAASAATAGNAVSVEVGAVFPIAAVSADTAVVGSTAYWNSAMRQITASATGYAVGTFTATKSAGDTWAEVLIVDGSAASVSGALKQTATNCLFANTSVGAAAAQFCSRTPHFMRGDGCTSLQIAYANWVVGASSEALAGGVLTVEASIEYPAGTYTRVLWSGANSCAIGDGAAGALSDAVAVTIPRGAKFWVRTFASNPAGVPFYAWPTGVPASARLANEFAASGLTNKVMSGTITPSSSIAVYPALIVAQHTRPACFFIGDSIAAGYIDTQDDESLDLGTVARCVAPHFALTGAPFSGTTTAQFIANSTRRRAMVMPYVTHVVSEYGTNDLVGSTASVVIPRLLQLPGLFPGKKMIQTTILPRSSSTDAWATVANQTAINLTELTTLNMTIRSGLAGFENHIDVCAAVESSIDSGKFRVDLGVPSSDGIHPYLCLNAQIRRSGVFSPSLIA